MRRVYLVWLFIIVVLVALFYFYNKKQPKELSESIPVGAVSQTVENRVPPKGMKEYKNDTYSFSLFYPENLEVSERLEGEGAITITFQNISEQKGFQIFIVPYQEDQISEKRFRQDVPSGIRTGLENFTINGATGATFYSENDLLGKTYEVWFINKGYLFEITTLGSLDTWLKELMQTLILE